MKKAIIYIGSIGLVIGVLLMLTSFSFSGPKHSIDHYENAIRQCFNEERWDAGKILLDEAAPYYGEVGVFYELKGWWYYHLKDYRNSRYNLYKAIHDDETNTHARTLISKVEEETHNYSTAIYYINELLENNAYDKTLWNRKINLYRHLNNDIEADRLLFRLQEIYPNDTIVRLNALDRYNELYNAARKNGDNISRLKAARHIVDIDPSSSNYEMLVNSLMVNGRRGEAADVSAECAFKTNSLPMIKKHVAILCEQGRHYEALSFIANFPNASSLKGMVEEELARYANQYDPYTAYARIYDKTHNSESFNYLVNTGISRGYYDDALSYINDYKRRNRETEDICYKEYVIYSHLNNNGRAIDALERLLAHNPNNTDAVDELCTLYFKQSRDLIQDREFNKAIPYLTYIVNNTTYDDMKETAVSQLANCYEELREYDMAVAVLNTSDSIYSDRISDLLIKSGKYEEALNYLSEEDTIHYEEIMIPYIKNLMAYRKYSIAKPIIDSTLTVIHPRELYMYAISCARALGEPNRDYIIDGISRYPIDEYFISQYCGLANDSAMALRSGKQYADAMAVVDSALTYNKSDRELLYTKGLLYENLHQYDSAFVYQKFYNPSNIETFEFKKKLQGLKMRTLKNSIAVDYQQARLGNQDILTANAGIEYSRQFRPTDSYTVGVNYAGRDDGATADELLTQQTPGGSGFLFSAAYEHYFERFNGSLGGSLSYGTKYFPKFSAKIFGTKELANDWTFNAHLQYKKLDSYTKVGKIASDGLTESMVFSHWNHSYNDMWNLGVGFNKPIEQFDINGGVDLFSIRNKVYFNANTKIQYMPIEGNKTRVYIGGGLGTAPEITLIEKSLPTTFDKFNSFVNMGGVYNFNENIGVGLEGSWHTMYKQNEILGLDKTEMKTTYVNLFYLHTQLFIRF